MIAVYNPDYKPNILYGIDQSWRTVTIFPDGTSQVWKLSEEILSWKKVVIRWDFEKEEEFLWVAQLAHLLDKYCSNVTLEMPYLPYARQDKEISNESTFALSVFSKLLNTLPLKSVVVYDAHSKIASKLIVGLDDQFPQEKLFRFIKRGTTDFICYPDAGAKERYKNIICNVKQYIHSEICGEKTRDQSTGNITKYKVITDAVADWTTLKDKSILIVDDICDGGMTFIFLAKELRKMGVKEVNLYVTHGIFSKGIRCLRDAGINRIFTYNGEIGLEHNNKHHGSSFDEFVETLPDEEQKNIKGEK